VHGNRFVVLQAFLTEQEAQRIELSIAREEALVKLQSDLENDVVELTRLADIKV